MKALQETKKKITEYIATVPSFALNEHGEDMHDRLITYMKNGKGIRGGLCMVTYELLGGTDANVSVRAGSALEFFQAMILIIDDIMDGDETRRGLPTIHKQIGTDYAMCVSLNAAFDGVSMLKGFPDEAFAIIHQVMKETSYAQMLEQEVDNPSKEEILRIYKYKTGRYTFSLPFSLGAVLVNKNELVPLLQDIGGELGILFQIKDDLLELNSSDETIGKSVKSDIRNNTYTYQRHLLQTAATTEEQKIIASIFGTEPSDEQLNALHQLYNKYDIQKTITQEMDTLVESINKKIEQLPTALQSAIKELTQYIITRSK